MTPGVNDKNLRFVGEEEYGGPMKTLILGLVLFIAPITQANAYVITTPSSMSFGGVRVNSTAEQTFFLQNLGSQSVQVSNCYASGSAFQCVLNCFQLLPGQSCMGTIYFRPITQSYESGIVNISMIGDFSSIFVTGSGI